MIRHFPPSEGIYLNSGTLNKCPVSVVSAVHRYLDEYEINPARSLFQTWAKFWEIQQSVAQYFGASPIDLFLRPNVTYAMNDFILGVELPKNGSIVVSDLEYGAVVNICKLRAKRDSRELVTIKFKTGESSYASSDEVAQDILRQLPPDACLVMLSHVMTGTGLLLPIDKIGKELRKRNILFAVDGAHGPGATPLHFDNLQNIDFYGGNLHKWFMGPKGTAFGWANKRVQPKIQPIYGTWTTSLPVNEHFQVFADGNAFALQMLMSHTNNFPPYFALKETMDFWKMHGAENIFKRINELQSYTEKVMAEVFNWPLLTPKTHGLRGPLLSYSLPPSLQDKGFSLVVEMWEKHRVQIMVPVVQGKPCLRLSPHVYNTEKEIFEGITKFKKYVETFTA